MDDRLEYIDVGGGLGVDYDGSQSDTPSSMNYALEEVRHRDRLPHRVGLRRPRPAPPDDRRRIGASLGDLPERAGGRGHGQVGSFCAGPHPRSVDDRPRWHCRAPALGRHARSPGVGGSGSHCGVLPRRRRGSPSGDATATRSDISTCSGLRWREDVHAACLALVECSSEIERASEEVEDHSTQLLDMVYFCNFSALPVPAGCMGHGSGTFQVSAPSADSTSLPSRTAVLGDLACDSDGEIGRFMGEEEMRPALDVQAS